jgi:hypothetical protein
MNIRRKRERVRTPHPDPRVEAELQKILMLRRMADGYEEQIQRHADVVEDAQRAIKGAATRHGRKKSSATFITAEQVDKVAEISARRIAQAEDKMTALRGEVRRVHDEIADLMAKLADTDLAFLEPEP